MAFLKSVFDANEREVNRLRQTAAATNALEPEISTLADEALAAKTAEFKQRLANGEALDAMLPETFAVVREAGETHARHAPLRRSDHGRPGAARGQGRRDEDGRRQDARRHAGRLRQRAARPRRPRRHRQRLPGQARRRVDVADLQLPRPDGRRDPARPRAERPARRVQLRHHVRHQQRSRLRLPARQHGVAARRDGAARTVLRDRRRSRLDPHRRGAHAAHHQRPGSGRDRPLRQVRAVRAAPGEGRGLHGRREGARRADHGGGRREGRADARRDEPLRPAQPRTDAPVQRRAQGVEPVPQRPAVHRQGRRGHHRRRVHRPPHVRPPLLRRHPPGDRGERRPQGPQRGPDARDDHVPELLPALREAGAA